MSPRRSASAHSTSSPRERPPEWRNRLIWGDKKYVLPSLLAEFSGAVDLIYIDPPFATGADFSLPIKLEASSFTKEPSVIEQKAYRDTWGVSQKIGAGVLPRTIDTSGGSTTRLTVLRDLLTEQGSIYVHIGPNVSHLVRSCLDEVFGVANFRAEIIWKRTSAHSDVGQGARHLGRVHDSILLYTASDQFVWHQPHADTTRSTSRRTTHTLRRTRVDGTASGTSPARWRR